MGRVTGVKMVAAAVGLSMLPEAQLFADAADAAKIEPLLTMREFAESKIILPDGPYKNQKLRLERQPYLGFVLDAIDSGVYRKFVFTGPVQSGKTLSILIPLMYYLFECGETVVFGVPTADIAKEKWVKDIRPMIEKCPDFAHLLPKSGPGSREGASASMITFGNGAMLKFMTGRGRDESRSHFPTRIVFLSEVDKMDTVAAGSRETDPVSQIEGRAGSAGSNARIFQECSPSFTTGRITVEWSQSTASQLALRCPHCGSLRLFDRQHFTGWEQAKTIAEAENNAAFCCPACGCVWSAEDRHQANINGHVIHGHQHIEDKDTIVGDEVKNPTFGLRWTAANNMFIDEPTLASREWVAANNVDDLTESAEREVLQQRWGLPYDPPKNTYKQARVGDITARMPMPETGLVKGVVPADAEKIVVGVDVGGTTRHHWIAKALRPGGQRHIFDYDTVEVRSDKVDEEEAIIRGLQELWKSIISTGWATNEDADERVHIDLMGIDCGYKTYESVYPFIESLGISNVIATMGFGEHQLAGGRYRPASQATLETVGLMTDRWHLQWLPEHSSIWMASFDADYYKRRSQQGMSLPLTAPRATTIYYKRNAKEHIPLAKQLASEVLESTFQVGKGWVEKFVKRYYANHYLDSDAIAELLIDIAVESDQQQEQAQTAAEQPRIVVPSLTFGV